MSVSPIFDRFALRLAAFLDCSLACGPRLLLAVTGVAAAACSDPAAMLCCTLLLLLPAVLCTFAVLPVPPAIEAGTG